MAQICIDVADSLAPRVVNALCIDGARPEDSPLTKGQFAKQHVARYVKRVVREVEARIARDDAGTAAAAAADAEIVIT
jgi:hypothetical protein